MVRSLAEDTLLIKARWVERIMDSTGHLTPLDTLPPDYCSASGWVQILPQRITLPPGGKASFKLWMRVRPPFSDSPECRSHLMIQASPLPRALTLTDSAHPIRVQLQVIPGVTVPVFLRARQESQLPGQLVPQEVTRDSSLHIRFYRQGARSVSAIVRVYLRDTTLVRRQGFYAPTRVFIVTFPWRGDVPKVVQVEVEDVDTRRRNTYRLTVR